MSRSLAWMRAGCGPAVAISVAALAAPLPEPITGVLVFPGDHPWGVYFEPGFSWEWARSERQTKYRLLAAAKVYVPEFGPIGSPGDAAAAARALGATEPVHLVELAGEPIRGPHLAVRGLRILDGRPEVPWSLASKLGELRARFDGAVVANRAALDGEYRRARDRVRADPGGKILRDLAEAELVIYRPAWLPNTRRLEVFFAYKRQGGFWIKSRRQRKRDGPRVKYAPPPEERGVSFTAAMGAKYTVDAAGQVAFKVVIPPAEFTFADWVARVTAKPRDEPAPDTPAGVALILTSDRPRLRAGQGATFLLRLVNSSPGPVWTNPSIICTGSWDFVVRDAAGRRVRVDDRDAMGCPSGGVLRTRIESGADTSITVGWDGLVRPHPGSSHPAPHGRYAVEATARWSAREGVANASGPRTSIASARAEVVVD